MWILVFAACTGAGVKVVGDDTGDSGPDGPELFDPDYVNCSYTGTTSAGESLEGAFDELGRVTFITLEGSASIFDDYTHRFEYDAGDNLFDRIRIDVGADGTSEKLSTLTWLGPDQLLLLEEDDDLDGVVDTRRSWDWLEDGWVRAERVDEGDDGFIDSLMEYTYQVEGDRTLQTGALDEGADGTLEARIVTSFTTGDRLARERAIDEDANGDVEGWYDFTYDAGGNLLVTHAEYYVELEYESSSTFTYVRDGVGRQTHYEIDRGDDGVIDYSSDWTWTCP